MTLYTDIDPFCCEVLRARVADGGLPPGEVWERDVRTLTADELAPFTQVHLFCGIGGIPLGLAWAGWPAEWSIVTGGFPCQDVSSAGRGRGLDGERSGLFFEMARIIRERQPSWVFGENVGALSKRGMDRVVGALESCGYAVADPVRVGAWALGAPHTRERWWIAAVSDRLGAGREPWRGMQGHEGRAGLGRGEPAGGDQPSRPVEDAGHDAQPERARAAGRQSREWTPERGQSARSGALVLPEHDGGRGDEPGARPEGRTPARRPGAPLRHAEPAGLEGHGADAGSPEVAESRYAEPSARRGWPAGFGPEQHGWEAPRLAQPGLDGAADGLPRRVASYLRREGVRACGNAVVPQVVAAVARGMIAYGRELEQE